MCSETAVLVKILLLWIFACPHHFAGVWDAWGGTEAKLLKNVETSGHDTMRTVIDAVLKLRELRKDLIDKTNEKEPLPDSEDTRGEDGGEDSDGSCVDGEDVEVDADFDKNVYKVHGCHVELPSG